VFGDASTDYTPRVFVCLLNMRNINPIIERVFRSISRFSISVLHSCLNTVIREAIPILSRSSLNIALKLAISSKSYFSDVGFVKAIILRYDFSGGDRRGGAI
jgi:hypothetical protein